MVCELSGGVHLFSGYALFVGCCIPFLFFFLGYSILVSLPPTFIPHLNVAFDIQGAFRLESLLLTKVIQESKLLTVIVGGFTNDHKSAAVRSQGVRFPSYGRFKVLKRTDLEFSRVMGCPPGIERLYDRLPWLVHDYCYKMHWGKVVLPLMVKFLHWIRCKWKI